MPEIESPEVHFCHLLFPYLKGKGSWKYVDLNSFSVCMHEIYNKYTVEKICKNPYEFNKWINFYHKLLNCDFSYGGYLEDRQVLWGGHYQEALKAIHYGVDLTVPEGIPVHIPIDGKLIDIFIDKDQDGGWGGRLTFETKKGFLLFGHLDISTTKDNYSAGDIVGTIAGPERNGGWWPHLHVQLMKNFHKDVDGYGSYYMGIHKDFINPLRNF